MFKLDKFSPVNFEQPSNVLSIDSTFDESKWAKAAVSKFWQPEKVLAKLFMWWVFKLDKSTSSKSLLFWNIFSIVSIGWWNVILNDKIFWSDDSKSLKEFFWKILSSNTSDE